MSEGMQTAAGSVSRSRMRRIGWRRPLEYTGLAVQGGAERKSGKFAAQCLGNQPGGDGLAAAPRGDRVDRESVRDSQAEQLHHGPCARTDLDPQLEHDARLLPAIVQAPPPLQVVKQRFDTPSARVQLDDRWRVQTAFGGKDQAGLCPCLPLLVEELAPHGVYRK